MYYKVLMVLWYTPFGNGTQNVRLVDAPSSPYSSLCGK